MHSSYINENPGAAQQSNERLEYIGDAVLGLAIAEKLYRDYPHLSEGELTRLRAALVRREALSRAAKLLKLGDYLYLGRGEEASGGRSKPRNLASSLEAVIAAMFLDRGIDTARDFILRLLDNELQKAVGLGVADYKSRLQELLQAREQGTPVYRLVEAQGPPHQQTFTVEVMFADAALGRGSGRSKKMAEKEAARAALQCLSPDFTP